jgi:hypothetical protein
VSPAVRSADARSARALVAGLVCALALITFERAIEIDCSVIGLEREPVRHLCALLDFLCSAEKM